MRDRAKKPYVFSKDKRFCLCLERFNRSSRRLFLPLASNPTNKAIAKTVTPRENFLDKFTESPPSPSKKTVLYLLKPSKHYRNSTFTADNN